MTEGSPPAIGRFGRRLRATAAGIVAAAMMAGMAACGSDKESPEKGSSSSGGSASVGQLYPGPISFLTQAAESSGAFENNEVSTTITKGASAPEMVAATVAGDIDVSIQPVNVIVAANANGECIDVLGQAAGNINNLIGQPDIDWPNAGDGIRGVRDLKGKTVGVPSRGGLNETWLNLLLEAEGMSPSDVTYVAVGALATAATAFEQKTIDAAVSYAPMEHVIGEGKYTSLVETVGVSGTPVSDIMAGVVVASCDWIEANPDVALSVCTAYSQAIDAAQDPAQESDTMKYMGEAVGDAALGEPAWNESKGWIAKEFPIAQELWEAQDAFLPSELRGKLGNYEDVVYQPCQSL
jgi:NitT/TauT family transport system substrate-binding protein